MTLPIADRLLVALAGEPMSEDDLVLTFPRASRDVIRLKLTELKRSGRVVGNDGVYRIAPGQAAPADALEAVEEESRAVRVDGERRAASASEAAARQRPPAALTEYGYRDCAQCRARKPLLEFPRVRGGGVGPRCKACRAAGAGAKHRQARLQAELRGERPPAAAPATTREPAPVEAPEVEQEITEASQTSATVLEFPTGAARERTATPGQSGPATSARVSIRSMTLITVVDAPMNTVWNLTLSDAGVEALRAALGRG